jgi:predicted RNA polymerase sigma factor
MLEGPGPGLRLLKQLEQPLAGHHRLHAVRAHLLEMAGELDAAFVDYAAAARGTNSVPERNYLAIKATRLSDRIHRREGL